MKIPALAALVVANITAALLLWSTCTQGYAKRSYRVSDLRYGEIDVDGDGRYTPGDDMVVEFLVENAHHILREALRTAKLNPDGGFDLSAYLRLFNAERWRKKSEK